MRLKKIIGKIHLWLGLASGLLVFFLGLTGCVLAFEIEIRNLTEPEQYVKEEGRPVLPPSILKANAEKYLDGNKLNGIEYRAKGRSVIGYFYNATEYKIILLNPYSGQVLKVRDMNKDFFRTVLNGHYYLWLPPRIGQPIVASATLVFLIMMITGLVLWWPKNKHATKQRFSIKWSARWRRKNYDLHTVLGFYITWIAIFIAISGLTMGFQWFASSVYWVSSAGKSMPAGTYPGSDTTQSITYQQPYDEAWRKLNLKAKGNESVSLYFPASKAGSISGMVNHRPGTFYKMDYYHFDQYTLKELPASGIFSGTFKEAPAADKINRMNYDIHVGAVLGLPGKILAFFASLLAASLPVTGFLLWRGRKKKKGKLMAA